MNASGDARVSPEGLAYQSRRDWLRVNREDAVGINLQRDSRHDQRALGPDHVEEKVYDLRRLPRKIVELVPRGLDPDRPAPRDPKSLQGFLELLPGDGLPEELLFEREPAKAKMRPDVPFPDNASQRQ